MSIFSNNFAILVTDYKSCAELLEAGFEKNGYYEIDPDGTETGVDGFLVFCDMCSAKPVTTAPTGMFYLINYVFN